MIEQTQKILDQKEEQKPRAVNENVGFIVSTHIKIFDPNSGEILVQKRGDS